MNSIGIYVVITIIGGLLLYMQIQKLTKKLDEDGAEKGIRVQNGDLAIVQNTSEKYQKFCDSIDARLRELKQSALYD
ncbi:MAG: hypothetical protein LUC34_07450, partial [Campylobacter sp.]|nr:hypothetical protein [Campylobacter sp.]